MKYLILTLLLCGCGFTYKSAEPRFKRGQEVKYKVPEFYRLVCSGKGVVEDLLNCWEDCSYTVTTGFDEKGCPERLMFREKDLK